MPRSFEIRAKEWSRDLISCLLVSTRPGLAFQLFSRGPGIGSVDHMKNTLKIAFTLHNIHRHHNTVCESKLTTCYDNIDLKSKLNELAQKQSARTEL